MLLLEVHEAQSAPVKTQATSHVLPHQLPLHNLQAPAHPRRVRVPNALDLEPCKTPSPQLDSDEPSQACRTGSRCMFRQEHQNHHPSRTWFQVRLFQIPRAAFLRPYRNALSETAALLLPASKYHVQESLALLNDTRARDQQSIKGSVLLTTSHRPVWRMPSR